MQITIWENFSKRKNSTKIPSGGRTVDCVLKNPSSITNPILQLQNTGKFNYFKMEGSYYYVSDIVHITNDVIEVRGSRDVLATFRSEILSTRAYVRRSSSSYSVHITDGMNTPTYMIERTTTETELPAFNFSTPGSFVMGVRGKTTVQGNESGFINYFNLNGAQLAALANAFNDSSIITDIVLSLADVMDTINCLYYVPFAYGTLGGAQANLYFADVDSGISAMQMFARQRGQSAYIRVPISIPSLEDDSGNISRCYLRTRPYTEILLTLPFLGTVSLDPSLFYDVDSVGVEYHLDLMTGDILYKVGKSGNDGNTLYEVYSANCYSAVPVARTAHEYLRFASQMFDSAVAALSGNIPNIVDLTQSALQTHTTINGSASTGLGIHISNKAQVTTIYRRPREGLLLNSAVRGLPCNSVVTLSSLAGYCECDGVSVDCTAFDSEKESINSYLNTGFFIE